MKLCVILPPPPPAATQVQQLLDDHQTLTQGLQFSPFKKIFEQQIDEWDGHLRLMNKILEVCSICGAARKLKTGTVCSYRE